MDEPTEPKFFKGGKHWKIFDTCLGVLKIFYQGLSERPYTIFAWFSRPPAKLGV